MHAYSVMNRFIHTNALTDTPSILVQTADKVFAISSFVNLFIHTAVTEGGVCVCEGERERERDACMEHLTASVLCVCAVGESPN